MKTNTLPQTVVLDTFNVNININKTTSNYLGRETFILTGILSVGFALSTNNSDLMSGEMNQNSSVNSMRQMKVMQQMEMMAPVRVGCVKSLGTFL